MLDLRRLRAGEISDEEVVRFIRSLPCHFAALVFTVPFQNDSLPVCQVEYLLTSVTNITYIIHCMPFSFVYVHTKYI